LAFVAGYGSDLFFVALDKIVQAFVPASATSDTTIKRSTTGGITTTTIEDKTATVARRQAANVDGDAAVQDDRKVVRLDPPDSAGSNMPSSDLQGMPAVASRS
jgi:hypothetical protein